MSAIQSWQVCPMCNGEGSIWKPICTVPITCTVCNGHKIISTLTGKPPGSGIINLTPQDDWRVTPQ